MAISTEILPVAAIGRVIVMVSIPVMNGQEVTVQGIKFTTAPRTNQTMDGQRSLPVIFTRRLLIGLLEFSDDIFGGLSRSPALADVRGNAPPLAPEADFRQNQALLRLRD
jgi:hypothetical protein